MPNGKKKKGHKMATHKRKKRLRKNRHKSKEAIAQNTPQPVRLNGVSRSPFGILGHALFGYIN